MPVNKRVKTNKNNSSRDQVSDRPFISAIVLAAGMSKRMGQPKQLVKMGDQTLLERTLAAVTGSMASETVLVLGYEAETILKSIAPGGAAKKTKIVINDFYAEGMSTSLQAGLRSVAPESNAALVVLADQPFISASIINQIIDAYQHQKAPIILPKYKGFRGNPVLVDRSLFEEMARISGDIGCRSIFGLHPEGLHTVEVNDIGILIDIDTAEDLKKFSPTEERNLNDALLTLSLDDRSVEQYAAIENQKPESNRGQLVIIGGTAQALSLVKLGKALQFRVTVLDPFLAKNQLPDADEIIHELDLKHAGISSESCIVIASGGKYDEDALAQALETPAGYIGLVGSKKRAAEIIQRLRSSGVPDENLKRVKSPAGIEIHASTPEEIALSILAEIVSIRNMLEKGKKK